MNEHIQKAKDALRMGDRGTAEVEFRLALEDPDPSVKRIAQNYLTDLSPEEVYGSDWSNLYHRRQCPATGATYQQNFVTFRDWEDAESKGCSRCPQCKPRRPQSRRL